MTKEEAFEQYMTSVFEEEFDPSDSRHLTFQGLFFSGWEAANDQ